MAYDIQVNLIPDLPKEAFDQGIKGVVGHSTANNGDSADGERSYESRTWQSAFVHFFVDDQKIEQIADWHYVAYGAGHTANHLGYIQVELCQSTDSAKFSAAYARYVWLLAYLLFTNHLQVVDNDTLMSHAQVSAKWGETTHTDPIDYLASHGKSWANLVADVKAEYAKMSTPVAPTSLYRIRKSWDDPKSQIGAYANLDSAKAIADQNSGYFVFDPNGKVVYPVVQATPTHMYRVRIDWADAKSQIGAFSNLDNAKALADQNPDHKVFDENGNVVYAPVVKPAPVATPTPAPVPDPKPVFVGTDILGKSVATVNQMNQYLRAKNPNAPLLAETYAKMEAVYGVRADIAFAQMCKETNNFLFTGRDPVTSNNPAGLGATDSTQAYNTFDTIEHGIEAQVQHLFAYASDKLLPVANVYDQRFGYVHRGAAPYVEYLGINENPLHVGWASDPNYGQGILNVLAEVLKAEDKPVDVPVVAPIAPVEPKPVEPTPAPAEPDVADKVAQELKDPANVSLLKQLWLFLCKIFGGGKQ